MITNILDLVKKLSINDKKTISQKTLKTVEEVGELSEAVLAYEDAPGQKHKFLVDRNKILEEVADATLCTLSIGYSLGFTTEEIFETMKEKSLYWADLQNRESKITNMIPYEIHVTVKNVDKEDFRRICSVLNVKPIILDLQQRDGKSVFEDVMTSSIFTGNNQSAFAEMKRITSAMKKAGFEIVREKIETVPWHPAAPSRAHIKAKMPKNCYFETHFNVVCTKSKMKKLQSLAKECDAHLSKNIYKKINNKEFMIMFTYRLYKGTVEDFKEKNDDIKKILADNNFIIEKEITEFSIFDTKISHDAAWLKK